MQTDFVKCFLLYKRNSALLFARCVTDNISFPITLFRFSYLIPHIGPWPNKQQYLCMSLNICVWGLSILCQLTLFFFPVPAQTPKEWERRQWQFGLRLIWVYPFDQALFKQMVRSQWLTPAWSDPRHDFTFIFRIVFLWVPALFLMNPFFLPTDFTSASFKIYVSIWLNPIWNDLGGGWMATSPHIFPWPSH